MVACATEMVAMLNPGREPPLALSESPTGRTLQVGMYTYEKLDRPPGWQDRIFFQPDVKVTRLWRANTGINIHFMAQFKL